MEPMTTATGVFIAFEGGEGAGKSTQARFLADWLSGDGYEVVLTREPGGTDLGAELRRLVLHKGSAVSPRTEALVYAADRAEHVAAAIRPALARGAVVITDRYVDSTLAYQGAGRGLDLDALRWLNSWATRGLRPHLTILLDIDPVTGLGRAGEHDRIESEPLEFHARIREHFLSLVAADPDRYLVASAIGAREETARTVRSAVTPFLGQAKRGGA
jgi:dTMP kinase